MKANCPQCNTPIQPDSLYCDICGANLAEIMSASTMPYAPPPGGAPECAMCGFANPPLTKICEYCGTSLSQPPGGKQQHPPQPVAMPDLAAQTQATSPPPDPLRNGANNMPETAAEPPIPTETSPAAFIIQPNGEVIILPPGATGLIVGREDVVSNIYPDIDLSPYDALKLGVGRKHLRLIFQENQAYIEDLQSVNGSHLNGQRLSPNQIVPIHNGDELILGRLKLLYQSG